MSIELIDKHLYLEDILEISHLQFGENFLSREEILSYINSDNAWIQGHIINQKLQSFSFMKVLSFSQLQKEFQDKPKELMEAFHPLMKNIAVRTFTGVHPNFEGNGFASELVSSGILFLKDKADTLFCEAWESDQGLHIGNILERHGYNLWRRIPNYWAVESQKKQYICATCGAPPCQCTGVIYTCNLNDYD